MRRWVLIIVLVLTCIKGWSQDDTIRTQTYTYDTAAYYYYYDSSYHLQEPVRAPNRNPIYYFDSPFCDHFFEIKNFLSQGMLGFGLNYTYLPEVWGGNITIARGSDYVAPTDLAHLSLGGNYRLSKPWWVVDMQLYSNIGIMAADNFTWFHPTLEAGCRFAWGEGFERFSLNSISIGVMTDFYATYATLGCSLVLAPISLIFIALPFW